MLNTTPIMYMQLFLSLLCLGLAGMANRVIGMRKWNGALAYLIIAILCFAGYVTRVLNFNLPQGVDVGNLIAELVGAFSLPVAVGGYYAYKFRREAKSDPFGILDTPKDS